MAIKAVGQFTITDLNDAIISGTKPLNPTVDQLWIKRIPDAPDELYSWNGTDWVPQTLSLDTLDADKSKQINDTTDTVTEIVDVVVPELEDAISQKLSITTYDDAVGVNKWVSTVYPISTSINLNTTPPAFDMFKGVSPTSVDEVVDGSTIAIKSGSNQITHLFTRVFLKVAKTISLSMLFDDSIAVYMNGASVYQSKYLGASTRGSASLSLRAGWNTIEILHGQATGTPVLDLGTKISTQVDRFTSVVGVGDKNETRLTRAETEILQTTSQIALKANQTDVTSMGNRISTAEGQLTVQSNQIATKVAQSTFDAYSQRVTTAESNITQLSDKIATKVAQTDYDNLNSKVTNQATTITQMSDSIALKASKTDVDALAGRVSTTETSIVQANNAIALKASQSSLDSVTNRVTTAESNITAQSNQIALKVAKTDMNAMSALNTLHNSEWLTNANKWSLGTGWTLDTTTKYQTSNTMKQIQSGATSNNYYALQSENISCTVGDVLTASIYAMTDDYTKFDLGATIEVDFFNSSNARISYPSTAITLTANSTWQRFIVTGTAPAGTTYARLRVHVGKNGRLWVARPMLQTGIFASIFTPHVDELATDLISRVSGAETSIIQTNNAIALKANATDVYTKTEADGKVTTAVTNAKSEIKATTDSISSTVSSISTSVDNLGTKVDSQATEIKQTKDDISLNVVKKDSIVASINASSEGIKMVASKIDLTGAVTINALDDATKAKVTNALDTTASYNGVKIDANNGIVVTKGDGKSRTRLNATEGLKIQKSTDGVNYTDVLYADTAGVLYAKGLVLDNASSLGGTVVSTVVANASSGATANSTIVNNKGTWDRSGNINADGTYNAGKIAGQLSDTQIASSSAWNTATVNVGDMVSDLKISPLEKSQLSRDWESIKAEYAQVTAMATALGVTQTAFVNAYNAFEGTTPKIASEILATMNATYTFASTTTRDAFKTKFTTYYVEKEKLRKLVSDTINSTATTAKTRTDDMISDMKVTPLEKSQLSRDWEAIKAEYAQLSTQATALGVSTTAYDTSYSNMDAVSPKIATEILASMSTTYTFASTTARDLFKTQINTYFAEAQKIRKAISDKIQSNVDSINVGGRNYYKSSTNISLLMNNPIVVKNPSTAPNGFRVTGLQNQVGSIRLMNVITGNGYWTISFWGMANGASTLNMDVCDGDSKTFNFTTSWQKFTFTANVTNWSDLYSFVDINGINWIDYDIKELKIEQGNKPTDWSPAPEDVQTLISTATADAKKANDMLTDMASDSKITPTEKVQLKKEWATISAEKPTYEALATTYGITTEKTNYVTSYNNLNTALNGASGVLLDMTVTTSVVGATFRATFDDYYDKKALLIRKVNEMSRTIGNTAQTTANTAQTTANSKAKTFTSTPTIPYSVGDIWVQGASGDVMHCVTARASGSYTASDWVKSTKYTDDTTANIATEIARGMASGKMMYTDPVFRNGLNNLAVYNNAGGGTVAVTRVAKPTDAPTSSAYAVEVKTTGTASPEWGGFILPVQSRASAKFIFKIIAKIPVGYTLNVASNSMGTGYTDRIVTSNQGTGKYEEYIRIVQCGTTGTFSGGGHFYLSGGTTPTSTTPLVWNVAYATVYDVADNDSMVYDMVSDMKVTPLEKNQLSRDWEAIKAEYSQVKDQATSVGVSSALITSYNTAYNNLNGSPPRIQTDILASMSTTYEFADAGARNTFKNQFTAYFTEAEKIKKAINDAINGVAVTADGKINDLKIGGRNLVYNSTGLILATDGITPDGWTGESIYELAEGQDAIKISTTLATEKTVRSGQINVKPNTSYAIRASVMGSLTANGFDLHFLGRKNGSDNEFDYTHSFTNMIVNGGYGDYLYTFTTNSDEVDGFVRLDNNGSKVVSATTAPTLALVANTGSTLTATTYYVKYTWANDEGETTASTQATLAVTAGNNLRITVPAFPVGVKMAKVYVGTASNVNKYQGDITTSGGNLVISTPIVTTSVAPPTVNSVPAHVWFSEIQLEEGTRNTEWSPSPTDMNVYTDMVKSQLKNDLQEGLSDKVTVMQLGGYATTEMVVNSATEVLATVDERIQNMQLDTFATSSALVQTANDLTVRFQSGGGVNLLKNSVGFADTDLWTSTGNVSTLQNEEISLHGSISAFSINNGNISQDVSVILNQYTISTVVKKDATGTGKINILNGAGAVISSYSIDARAYDYETISFTIDTSATNVMTVQLLADSTATIVFTSTMLNVGDIPLQWQQASGEVYNTNVKMDVNGLKVISNVYDGYTAITPEEFAGYARDDSGTMKKVFTLNKGVTEMTKADIDEEISMGSIKIVPVSEAGSTGWAFIGT